MQNVSRQAVMFYLLSYTGKELTNSVLLASDWLTISVCVIWFDKQKFIEKSQNDQQNSSPFTNPWFLQYFLIFYIISNPILLTRVWPNLCTLSYPLVWDPFYSQDCWTSSMESTLITCPVRVETVPKYNTSLTLLMWVNGFSE